MEYLPYIWAILGIMLMGAEFLMPGFVIFFFGVGALATALISAAIPGVTGRIVLQILLWLAFSGLSLTLLRKYVARVFKGKLLSPGEEDTSSGREAVVIERVVPDAPGRIRFRGTTWKAESFEETFEPGETVMILETDNLTCYVSRPIGTEGSELDQ